MSLREKLGGLSQKLEIEKKEKEQFEKNKQLAPIRANIKKLESSRRALDLVKGSLDFKETNKPENHIGMKDYAEKTDEKIKSKSGEIDALILENKEALNTLGIEDRDQLSGHPEFAEESEVVDYKGAVKQGEELKISDAKLKERLTKLGVEFEAENFSYETASQAVGKKIAEIDKELTQERLKTPEGREKTIESLAEELEKSTGKMELNSISGPRDKSMDRGYEKDQPDYSYGFGTDRRNFSVNFTDEKAKVTDWYNLKLIPGNFKDIEAVYGEEIAREALEKAYQNKVHDNFSRWDEHTDQAVSLKEQIKAVSPEERRAAQNKLDEFTKKQDEASRVLQEKSEELKAKGIDFNPRSARGDQYTDITGFDLHGTIEYVSESLYKNDFPSQYDFIKVREKIDVRIEKIDKFIEIIQNIKNKEDVNNLLENQNSDIYISNIYHNLVESDYRKDVRFKLEGNNNGSVRKLTDQCKTYRQAEDYLNEIIEKDAVGENKVSEAIINTVKAHLKMIELESEIKNEGIGEHIYNLEDKIKEISNGKELATEIMGEIEALQSQLSSDPKIAEEDLVLEKRYLIIPSIKKEYDDLRENKPLKEQEWQNKKREREKHEETPPKLFGKEKWRTRLNELEKEEEAARNETETLYKKDQDALYHKAYHFIESDQYTPIGKMVGRYEAQGKISEIFKGLKAELTKVIDATLPPKILQDYAEYKALVEKIN
jgi:hypothetical protein